MMKVAPFWTPSEEEIRQASVTKLREFANARHGLQMRDYWDLHRWSTGSPEEMNDFWTALWDWSGIIGDKGTVPLFDATGPITETKRFLAGARMNWAENMLLGHPFARSKTQLAIINVIEPDTTAQTQDSLASTFLRSHTFDELYLEVAQAASGLKKLGVGHGDRVAAFTPNNAEAVILLLAASSLGSIYSTVSPEFGVPAVLERFVQLKPKVLLSADKYRSAGKAIDIIPKLREVAAELKKGDLAHVVIVGQLKKDRRPEDHLPKLQGVNVLAYPDFLDKKAIEIEFWRGQSNAPLWVLYSSGTTGKPKPIVHGQLAMVLGHKQGILLHAGLKPGDRHLQITTTGWMMWNSTVGHLCCGITIMLYDGSPLVPNPTILFDLIDAYKITSFALSPRYLQVLLRAGIKPNKTHSLASLSAILSTGSPSNPDLYNYIQDCIGPVFINNVTGGTDVCAGLIGGAPDLPIYAGTMQAPMLGAAIEAWDDHAKRVYLGEGDLVMTKPYAMMPLGFLGDDEKGTRFKDAYFNHYQHTTVWYQADHMLIDEYGALNVLGRSDGVLNPQGVRFGSAELYAIVEEMKDDGSEDTGP